MTTRLADTDRVLNSQNDEEPYRSPFRRDYARLIHSAAFRRLQGKTQLFPGQESDFFRNRLSHSLEVAQIAKSIALKLNFELKKLPIKNPQRYEINTDLVEFAGLAHDLGHPPFGHLGEEALDELMKDNGGFEGNAQSLRLLAKLEKKSVLKKLPGNNVIDDSGKDLRVGLNLTFRSLASILKYNRVIPKDNAGRKTLLDKKEIQKLSPVKGYYEEEMDLVDKIKLSVCGNKPIPTKFKTVECQIMDYADDIAYSCYDLEDSFKAGFLSPLELLNLPEEELDYVTKCVNSAFETKRFSTEKIKKEIHSICGNLYDVFQLKKNVPPFIFKHLLSIAIESIHDDSEEVATCGYRRTELTSKLVGGFIQGISWNEIDKDIPALSTVKFNKKSRVQVEILKNVTFAHQILSPKLKIQAKRGKDIVKTIFDCIVEEKGEILPDDHKRIYSRLKNGQQQNRIICDFIAGMTDRYALEYYARLTSENPQTIFKPIN